MIRIWSRARSLAIGSVMPTSPPLAALYAAWPRCPSKAATEATLMITPRSASPSSSRWHMAAAHRRSTLNVPIRFTSTIRRNISSGMGPSRPTVLAAPPIPAQLILICSPPNFCIAESMARCTLCSSVMSPACQATSPATLAAASSSRSSSRSNISTFAPLATSARVAASPRPEAAPVTNAVFS